MGIVIKKSGYVTFFSYLGVFLGSINALWLLPYAFKPEEIGLIRLILAISAMFAIVASLGVPQISTKYFPYFSEQEDKKQKFLNLNSKIILIGIILFTLGFYIFQNDIISIYSEKSTLFVSFNKLVYPITISLILYGFLESWLVVQGFPIFPAIVREVYHRFLITLATICFIFFVKSLDIFLWIMTILYCLAPLIIFFYGEKENALKLKKAVAEIDSSLIYNMFQFGFFIFLGNVGAIILNNIDSILLSAYSGLTNTGIYSIAIYIAIIIEIPKRSLSQVLIPLVVKANKENDLLTLGKLYKKSSINQFIIGSAIFLIIWLNIDYIFLIIPNGAIYSTGKWVVFFLSLGKLFDMLTGINAEIIGTSKYYKVDLLLVFMVSLVGIALNYFLISKYSIIGASIAVMSSIILCNIIRFFFIAYVMNIQPFMRETLIVFSYFLLTYFIIDLIPIINMPIFDILIRSFFIIVFYGGMIIVSNVSEDITNTFKKMISRINKF